MTVLLTEDSGSGFQFWNIVNDYVFDGKLRVYHTGCASGDNNAGNTKFEGAAKALYDTGTIDENTDLILIYDSYDGVAETKEMRRNKRIFKFQLDACKAFLEEKSIRYYELDHYICWEQMILSFTKLPALLPIVHHTAVVTKYLHNIGIFTARTYNIKALSAYFGVNYGKYKSVEKGMAALLNYLTFTATPDTFKTFLISKGTFAECWWDNCADIRKNNPGITQDLCSVCSVAKMKNTEYWESGRNRFLYIVKNSRLKDICQLIWRISSARKDVNK